mgnify:CR=1 FL=1
MKKLSVIVPAFNEAATIVGVVKKLLTHKSVYEVIVVNDGSKDNTGKLVSKLKNSKLTIINHSKNQGKGKAGGGRGMKKIPLQGRHLGGEGGSLLVIWIVAAICCG